MYSKVDTIIIKYLRVCGRRECPVDSGSTPNKSSLPFTRSTYVVARGKGAVGRTTPSRTGASKASAASTSSSTERATNAAKTRRQRTSEDVIESGLKFLNFI